MSTRNAPIVTTTPNNALKSIYVTWTIDTSNWPMFGVLSYIIRWTKDGSLVGETAVAANVNNYTIITGLDNGATYNVSVIAVGTGFLVPSASIPTTLGPSAPTNLKAIPGNAQVQLSWSAVPNEGSPTTNYIIEYKLDTSSTWTVKYSMTTLIIIYFLKNGSLYNFKVAAVNASGPGSYTDPFNATPFIPFTTTSCGITGFVPGPPPWSRAGGNNCPNCVSNYGYAECTADNGLVYSTYALNERRKAEILKYKGNSAQLSPAMFYSMISRNAFTRKKSWATQTQTVTNPNVDNLPEIKNAGIPVALQCNQPPVTCSLTSDSDVPGPVIQLCIDASVPLYNYNLQVTPASGGKTMFAFEPQTRPPTPVQILFNTTAQTITTYLDANFNMLHNQTPVQGGYTVVQIRVAGSLVSFYFTTSGSSLSQINTKIVCVGGGGAGGLAVSAGGGGGGAGGFQEVDTACLLNNIYYCMVGTGGTNPVNGTPVAATNSYVYDLISIPNASFAGGQGKGFDTNSNGGSGGGSGGGLFIQNGGTGFQSQGYNGGNSSGGLASSGAGGGGALENGKNSHVDGGANGGNGGNGILTDILPNLSLAGGGGGGGGLGGIGGVGGKGGGGNSGTDASQWTGGGGGGQPFGSNSTTGNGGNGFIAFRFPSFSS